jgi:chromosome segregation ATPase
MKDDLMDPIIETLNSKLEALDSQREGLIEEIEALGRKLAATREDLERVDRDLSFHEQVRKRLENPGRPDMGDKK